MPQFQCHQCREHFVKERSARTNKGGRPRKHVFCNQACYERWRADQHLKTKARWLLFQREVWGTTEHGFRDVAKARQTARPYEIAARDTFLPREGFTEIVDMSEMSNQFFVDFIATKDGERVLVDATIKLKAYFPAKAKLAEALGMKLFFIHIAPAGGGLYYLHEVPSGRKVVRVPAAFIRALA